MFKSFSFLIVLCFLALNTFSQSDLSLVLGYNQNNQEYQPIAGVDIGMRLGIGQSNKIKYGIALHYDHFILDVASIYTSKTSIFSFGGFVEFLPFKIKKVEPYISASFSPALCHAKGRVSFIFIGTAEDEITFFCAQFSPGIGSRFEIAKNTSLQFDIKGVINYGSKFDFNGFYNYTCINVGISFKL